MFTLKKSLLTASIISLSMSAFSLANAASHEKAEPEKAETTMAPEKAEATPEKVEDSVVAVVNGDNIMNSTLIGYLEVLSQSKQGTPDMQTALDDLIATEIALQEAKKTDILEREESKKAISDYSRNVLLQTWTKEKVESFNIDDAAIKAAYDERVADLVSKEFNASHILVKTEDEAKTIITELNAEGADFAAIAKEKSTGPSSSNGGSLGWFKSSTMVPAFANAVEAMSKGDISKEPVKTQFGFHVIKLEDSRESKLPTLESLKDQLERVISQKQMLAYMDELKKTADITITLPEMPKMDEAKSPEKEETK